jgi:hypothetical protein
MKRFKELRNEITEIQEEHSEGGGFGYDPTLKSTGRSAHPYVQPTNYDDSHEMHKINSFISAFCSKSYVDPRSALYLLRAKLNLTGVDFKVDRSTKLEPNVDYSFPLKRFGGTFGTSPEHDLKQGFEETNGFGDKNYELKCKIIAPEGDGHSGLYILNAHIEEV